MASAQSHSSVSSGFSMSLRYAKQVISLWESAGVRGIFLSVFCNRLP
jgi:hypothetical protein